MSKQTVIHFQRSQLLGVWCVKRLPYPYHYSSTAKNVTCLECLRKAAAGMRKQLSKISSGRYDG